MLNETTSLQEWIQSAPKFSQQDSIIELMQSYQDWLKEYFNCSSE